VSLNTPASHLKSAKNKITLPVPPQFVGDKPRVATAIVYCEANFGDIDGKTANDLRLGEAILLGCETLHRQPINGLHTDVITLCDEVIEAKIKPSKPSGTITQTAFGEAPPVTDHGAWSCLSDSRISTRLASADTYWNHRHGSPP
jgi:hypothetical protein